VTLRRARRLPIVGPCLSDSLRCWLALLLVAAGCSAPGSAAPQGFTVGSTTHTMSFGGVDRSYRIYIPEGVQTPAPLVIMLHGGFGSA
jgi:polyhydroxybutyrate depolymerase